MPKLAIPTIAVLLSLTAAALAGPVYVDWNAPGPTYNGASWSTAFKSISQAITSGASSEVWVKAGVYRENLTLRKYSALYGGFLGSESSTAQRVPGAFPTVIDAGKQGRAIDTLASASNTIDGFTIRRGAANWGAGIRCSSYATVKIRNCRILDCSATQGGGGVYFDIYTQGEMTDCFVLDCKAPNGGGAIVEYHASPTLRRCVIAGNQAYQHGGGVYCPFHSAALLENCTVSFNSAGVQGGGIYADYGGPETFNYCIVTNNSAPAGGGIYGGGETTQSTIYRCDFHANAGGDWGGSIAEPPPTSGVIHADPLFIARDCDEYHLYASSPCVAMGAFPPEAIYRIDRIGGARYLADGSTARLSGKAVAFVDGDTTYVEETDRGAAIAVRGLAGLVRGNVLLYVEGALSTDANGRRVILAATCSRWTCGQYAPKPLGMPIRALSTAAGAYARTWGTVESLLPNGFTLRDGYHSIPVRYSGAPPQPGDRVSLTGVHAPDSTFPADAITCY